MALYLSTQKTKKSYSKQLKQAILTSVLVTTAIGLLMVSYYTSWIHIDIALIGLTLLFFLMGMIIMRFNIPMSLIIQRNVEPKQLGKVSSVMGVLSQAMIPIGSMLAGVIISQMSIIYFYVFSTIGSWLVIVFYLRNKASNNI